MKEMNLIGMTAALPLGDDTPIGLYAVLAILAIGALVATSLLGKKKDTRQSKHRNNKKDARR